MKAQVEAAQELANYRWLQVCQIVYDGKVLSNNKETVPKWKVGLDRGKNLSIFIRPGT